MQIGQIAPQVPPGLRSRGMTTITNATPGVGFGANTANKRSTIFSYKIPARQAYKIYDSVALRMKLHDSGDAEMPNNTKVYIGFQEPGIDTLDYRVFAALSVAQQNDERTRDARKVRTKFVGRPVKSVGLSSDRTLIVEVESSAVVSNTNSFFELDVEEFQTL